MIEYTVDELLDLFKKHAQEARDYEKERCKRNPSVYIETFMITDALYSMCLEIKKIKEKEENK